MTRSWQKFKIYALAHGVHNGPSTLAALYDLYTVHRGSHYVTITELFRARGEIVQRQQFELEMGCAKCIKEQNDQYRRATGREVTE